MIQKRGSGRDKIKIFKIALNKLLISQCKKLKQMTLKGLMSLIKMRIEKMTMTISYCFKEKINLSELTKFSTNKVQVNKSKFLKTQRIN